MEASSLQRRRLARGRIIALPAKTPGKDSLQQKIAHTGKLVLPTIKGFECLCFDEILFLKAQSNYTEIYTAQRKLLFSKTLKSIEDQLPQHLFSRVHKSYVVNVRWIKAYCSTAEDPHLVLDNDACIPVSRSRRTALKR